MFVQVLSAALQQSRPPPHLRELVRGECSDNARQTLTELQAEYRRYPGSA
jgi:hypothetical protein